jgi:hypothetical protein
MMRGGPNANDNFPDPADSFPVIRNIFPVNGRRELDEKRCGAAVFRFGFGPNVQKLQNYL